MGRWKDVIMHLKETGYKVVTAFIWLKIGPSGGVLRTFHRLRRISWLAEQPIVSKKTTALIGVG